jgi:hypothetical protein
LADAAKEQAAEEAKKPPVVPEIKILRDGFSGFQAKYRVSPSVVVILAINNVLERS